MRLFFISILVFLIFSCGSNTERVYYENGSLKSETELINLTEEQIRVPHGTEKLYYSNGQIKEKSKYDKGNKEGKSIVYYPNGDIKIVANFVLGKRDGWLYFYSSEGLLKSKSFYSRDKLIGPFYEYFESGNLKREVEFLEQDVELTYEYYPAGGTKKNYANKDSTTFYFKEYSESGDLLKILLPVSFIDTLNQFCISLDFSIYDEEELETLVYLKGKDDVKSFSSRGNTVCIEKAVITEDDIISGLVCEIESSTDRNQGCMGFEYIRSTGVIKINP